VTFEEMDTLQIMCRCCGKQVLHYDGNPIHTTCIPKHGGRHNYGVNASRCKEFGKRGRREVRA